MRKMLDMNEIGRRIKRPRNDNFFSDRKEYEKVVRDTILRLLSIHQLHQVTVRPTDPAIDAHLDESTVITRHSNKDRLDFVVDHYHLRYQKERS